MPQLDSAFFPPDQVFILYLHGFLSSPKSVKAQQVRNYCLAQGLEVYLPDLGFAPSECMAKMTQLLRKQQSQHGKHCVVIGSSLGGFYATYLAEEFGIRAALINPAVRPYQFWRTHIGHHKNYYSDQVHEVTLEHIEQLKSLDKPKLRVPGNYLLLVQEGDETLDYRQAVDKYRAGPCEIQKNGNHSFENFDRVIPQIFDFLLFRKSTEER